MTMQRREVLRLGALAALAPAFLPKLAFAADQPDLMPAVRAVIERWTAPGKFPGMIAALGLPGAPTQYVVRGSDSFTDLDPLTPDSLFRIYSMTKPITGMAAMILIDEGKLGLDQPVSNILPKFAKMQVQTTYDGSLTDLRPARTPITVRHLLTHTAGLGYAIIQMGPIRDAYVRAGLTGGQVTKGQFPGPLGEPSVQGLSVFADRLAEMPLVCEPGTRWSYSVGLDLLGRVIEVVSGMAFDTFLKQRLFDPTGMDSTYFQVPERDAGRLTTNFAAAGNILLPIDAGEASIYLDKPPLPFGGSGLVSSPRDYDRFLLMLANRGSIDGKRVMSEAAVRLGTSNLLPPGVTQPASGFGAVGGFGAGGRVGIGADAGKFGWAGAAGTIAEVDLNKGLRTGFYVQFMPPSSNSLQDDYRKAMAADLMTLQARVGI